jgi:hypothetical protein
MHFTMYPFLRTLCKAGSFLGGVLATTILNVVPPKCARMPALFMLSVRVRRLGAEGGQPGLLLMGAAALPRIKLTYFKTVTLSYFIIN